MRNETRQIFNQYTAQLERLNGIPKASESFTVEPSVQQKLEQRMQESSAFLSQIGMIGVNEMVGQKVGVGVNSTTAGRTNTDNKDRNPRNISDSEGHGYQCRFTEFDTSLPYSLLDAWAHRPEFQALIRNAILRQQALDRIMIGWNGISIAAETDRTANPLLQDVNKGWLQKYREHSAQRVMNEGKTAGKVAIGAGGDYKNLDALVYDARHSLLDTWHRQNPELVVLVGGDLLHDKYFPLVNENQQPTEKMATDLIISQKRMGGLQAVQVPYIPEGTLMITTLSNLAIYWQIGGRRRYITDNPRRNRIENFESSNEDYVVEDYGLGCVVENIKLEEEGGE